MKTSTKIVVGICILAVFAILILGHKENSNSSYDIASSNSQYDDYNANEDYRSYDYGPEQVYIGSDGRVRARR